MLGSDFRVRSSAQLGANEKMVRIHIQVVRNGKILSNCYIVWMFTRDGQKPPLPSYRGTYPILGFAGKSEISVLPFALVFQCFGNLVFAFFRTHPYCF